MKAKELITVFTACTEQLTLYYRALGDMRSCHLSNGLWFPDNPGLLIDFVPPVAREGVERMLKEAGITLLKTDGGKGKEAYFTLLAEGLTPEKLNALTERVRAETLKLLCSD